jgi:autotransporter-associated beta strand protein
VTVSAARNFNFGGSGVLSGTMALTKDGTGTLTLTTSNNTFSGGIVISNGTVQTASILANITAWGTGPITFMGGTIQFNGYGGNVGTGWGGMTNALIVPADQTGTLQLPPRWGYSYPFNSPLTGSGTLNLTLDYVRDYFTGNWSAFTGQINLATRAGSGDFVMPQDYSWPGLPNAAVNLGAGVNLYWSGNLNADGSSVCDLGEVSGASSTRISNESTSGRKLTYRIGGRNTDATYAGRISDGIGSTFITKLGSGIWILSGTNTYSGTTTISSGTLQFGDGGTAGTLPTNNVVNNAVLDFNHANNLTDSGVISATGTVVQDGDGTVTFTRSHTYSGPTLINSGTLTLSGGGSFSNSASINIALGATLDVSARTSGSWTLTSGKSLTGNGSVNGNFTVASGAKLLPGNSIGTLTFSNNLTLAAGSTNLLEISGTPLSADKLKVLGTLTCGGSLIVTNIGGSALAAGDTFKLFDAAVISGSFSGITLPALTGNLFWNTNNLFVDGTLTVASPTPPVLGTIALAGNKLIFSGSGGSAGGNYYLIGTTNLTVPLTNWQRLQTNQFGSGGSLNCTNTINANWPQGYYRVQVP